MDKLDYYKPENHKAIIKELINYAGMTQILEHTIDIIKELGNEDYLLTLRYDLETTLENYNRRHNNEK